MCCMLGHSAVRSLCTLSSFFNALLPRSLSVSLSLSLYGGIYTYVWYVRSTFYLSLFCLFYVRPYVCLSVCLSVCLPVCLGAYSVVGVVILATPQWSDPSLDCLDMLCTQNQYSWLVGSHSTSAAGGVSPCVRHSSIQNEAFSVDVTTSICNFYTSDSLCFSFCQ